MWSAKRQEKPGGGGLRFGLERNGRPASVMVVLRAMRGSEEFRSFFNDLLAETPYTAMRWETPAVSTSTYHQSFECVVLDFPKLARHPDQGAFAEHFEEDGPDVVSFSNHGRDAVMIVPRLVGEIEAYGHLASFVRAAPPSQRDELWRCVAETTLARISSQPVWLSTAGAGVSWLHVRLDDRPKYYGHMPYRHGVGRVAEVIHHAMPRRRRG